MFKYSIKLGIMKRSGRVSCPFYFRVSFLGQRVALYPGYGVDSAAEWDDKNKKVKSTNKNADFINAQIFADLAALNKLMVNYTIDNERSAPAVSELRTAFLAAIGRPDAVEKTEQKRQFWDIYAEFVKENGIKNEWSLSSYKKFRTLKNHLTEWKKPADPDFSDFDEPGLQDFLLYLHRCDFKNTTITKMFSFIRWFLRWCIAKGYIEKTATDHWRPRLKGIKGDNKEIIYLSFDELIQFLNTDYPAGRENLAAVRDIFIFCSFTGLRYSDVKQLKKTDISPDMSFIKVVTQKTADALTIELNKYSRLILERWAAADLPGGAALPVLSNQKYNKHLKEAAQIAGLNNLQRIVYFKRNKRFEEVYPKWQILTTHAARRSFVVNALRLGIQPAVIMSWTGHSNYQAMRPYIKIVDELKAENMAKFDSLGEK